MNLKNIPLKFLHQVNDFQPTLFYLPLIHLSRIEPALTFCPVSEGCACAFCSFLSRFVTWRFRY
ncbi:hypothetical protein EVA_08010 [gut metagenome]|uniref:Uncharacterized protein n=1 Tax=gut metagenome TaxID=749906 RepID=J9CUI2_9ZZZZ